MTSKISSALQRSCHLFRKCDMTCGCKGCVTGPANCSASCTLPPEKGGYWYCDHNTTNSMVRSMDRCYYMCPSQQLQMTRCLSGEWDTQIEGNKKFTCQFRSLNASLKIILIVSAIGNWGLYKKMKRMVH